MQKLTYPFNDQSDFLRFGDLSSSSMQKVQCITHRERFFYLYRIKKTSHFQNYFKTNHIYYACCILSVKGKLYVYICVFLSHQKHQSYCYILY